MLRPYLKTMHHTIFVGVHVILLMTFFWPLLHAKFSRRGQDVESLPVPANVIGIFISETNSPATAAKLAVENFNTNNPSSKAFTYTQLFTSHFEVKLTEAEISAALENSVVVTGDPLICEQLSKTLSHINSYLICYGPPTPTTLQTLESTSNLYLSQQNPEAFVPCLFNLIELLKLRHHIASSSSSSLSTAVVEGEVEDSYPLTVSILLDQAHPSALVQKPLFNNLSGKKIRVNISWLEESGCFSPKIHEAPVDDNGIHVVIAALYEFETKSLLCALHRRRCGGQRILLILLSGGVEFPSKEWLKDPHSEEHSSIPCGQDELLAAAEGHLLLEFPPWEIANERNTKIIRRELDRKLMENRERFRFYYNEAPLAYDSTWAMLQAITRANANFPPNGNSHHHHPHHSLKLEFGEVVEEELAESFIGLSGEMSFNWKRMRTGNKAVVIVNRFENGKYEEIGKHFNGNSSFPISKFWLGQKDEWNCTWGAAHPECRGNTEEPTKGDDDDDIGSGRRTVLIPLVCVGFLILALLFVYIVFVSTKERCKRKTFSRVVTQLD